MTTEGVKRLPASPDEIAKLLVRYRRHLRDAGIPNRDADSRYCSYFDAGLALTKIAARAHALRVTSSNMNHFVQIQLAKSILGKDAAPPLSLLENARTKRNHATYDEAGTISEAEVDELERTVVRLERLVCEWLARHHPDLLPPELPLG
ncbi:MAG: hypothetical protein U1E08_00630 [Coriobacteriia bacterium]|nr:hypothetical protein [Coriobacteriia bacterium]MDZ4166191.1 hypothetical protein [Coriobacteriia bacterium]